MYCLLLFMHVTLKLFMWLSDCTGGLCQQPAIGPIVLWSRMLIPAWPFDHDHATYSIWSSCSGNLGVGVGGGGGGFNLAPISSQLLALHNTVRTSYHDTTHTHTVHCTVYTVERPNSWTKSRQKSEEFSSLQFTVNPTKGFYSSPSPWAKVVWNWFVM